MTFGPLAMIISPRGWSADRRELSFPAINWVLNLTSASKALAQCVSSAVRRHIARMVASGPARAASVPEDGAHDLAPFAEIIAASAILDFGGFPVDPLMTLRGENAKAESSSSNIWTK